MRGQWLELILAFFQVGLRGGTQIIGLGKHLSPQPHCCCSSSLVFDAIVYIAEGPGPSARQLALQEVLYRLFWLPKRMGENSSSDRMLPECGRICVITVDLRAAYKTQIPGGGRHSGSVWTPGHCTGPTVSCCWVLPILSRISLSQALRGDVHGTNSTTC